MILKRFYEESLAHASYLVGCPEAGEACIVDPNRDFGQYIESAANEGLSITAVTETHIHADFLSGSRELALLTGAKLYLSDEGDVDWKYSFVHEPNVILVRNGDSFNVGGVKLEVVATPGHTPEHVSFLITDEPTSHQPLGAFTGDFVFVGDVGRPDLLENAAGVKGTMDPNARSLYSSVQLFLKLPDHLLLWPAHGSGSACGKSLGGVPVSSLGYERISNWGFRSPSESDFVKEVLTGQPEPPFYFAEMKRLNKVGPPMLNGLKTPARHLDDDRIAALVSQGAAVIDLRQSHEFASRHISGTLNIPLDKGFTTYCGWFVRFDQDIWLIAGDESEVTAAVRELSLIGLDRVVGWYGAECLERPGVATESYDQVRASEVPPDAFILDVRSTSEWSESHVNGARHIPVGHTERRSEELPKDQPIFVHCFAGTRSAIAMSVLRRQGFSNLVEVSDGFEGFLALPGAAKVFAEVR